MDAFDLLGGVGEGLQRGMQAYNQERDRQMQYWQQREALKARQDSQDLNMLTHGLTRGEDGRLTWDVNSVPYQSQQASMAAAIEKPKIELAKEGLMKNETGQYVSDPNSQSYKLAQAKIANEAEQAKMYGAHAQAFKAQAGGTGLLGSSTPAKPNEDGTIPTPDISSLPPAMQRIHLQMQRQANMDSRAIDSRMSPYVLVQGSLNKGMKTILNPPEGKFTKQVASDVNQEIAAALSGARASGGSDYKMKAQEMDSLYEEYKNALQKITGQAQDAVPEDIKRQMFSTLEHLQKIVAENMSSHLSKLGSAAANAGNPYYHNMLIEKKKNYGAAPQGLIGQAPGGVSGGGAPKMPKVGDIEDGHKFKGGNPADPKSWEAL